VDAASRRADGPPDEVESSLVEQVLKENPFAWDPYVDPTSGAAGFKVKAEAPEERDSPFS
jgi:hypothetical protein